MSDEQPGKPAARKREVHVFERAEPLIGTPENYFKPPPTHTPTTPTKPARRFP